MRIKNWPDLKVNLHKGDNWKFPPRILCFVQCSEFIRIYKLIVLLEASKGTRYTCPSCL